MGEFAAGLVLGAIVGAVATITYMVVDLYLETASDMDF